MTDTCRIVRDLMPLCLDGVASEPSRVLVEEHTKACPECSAYLEGLKASLPRRTAEEAETERAAFSALAKGLKRKTQRRVMRNVLLGVLIGALTLLGGLFGWQKLMWDDVDAPPDSYDVTLSQLRDGRVVVNIDLHGTTRYMAWTMGKSEDTVNVWALTHRVASSGRSDRPVQNTWVTVIGADEVSSLEKITKKGEAVWTRGEAIPPASAEMETYFEWQNIVGLFYDEGSVLMGGDDMRDEFKLYHSALAKQSEYLFSMVPEWQPYVYGAVEPAAPRVVERIRELAGEIWGYGEK